ncbi:MAG: HTH-type transcriptional regulator SinR [Candidatus Dichloromethanomonas elyunquensis]|nr:MAG: HTH-type transcriptional regulator SinR [Candidatus Dichloromethanomonas elyunquensis]
MLLGRNIRSFRQAKNMKQTELAERAGISISYLCEIEKEKTVPSIKTLLKIARALKVECSLLINHSEEI